ncbi:MAG: formate dehydrogenase accessory sulfurtransferase FdhD [Lentisphaerae bacterium]|nr:formate dehydrogenase accessory sulfurtransferase FdhD [Lentisphaerota bacterium]
MSGNAGFDCAVLAAVPEAVRARQSLFQATGGTHAAALFDARGKLLAVREDVGRHNALDKVIGYALLAGLEMAELGVFLSGRASLELIVKAARARIPVVLAVSAPTEAAIKLAEKTEITLAGFAREKSFTIYAGANRIDCSACGTTLINTPL